MAKIDILGVNFDNVSMNEAVDICENFLKKKQGNLIVTPKEIDFLIDNLSEVIAGGINESLHKSID